MAAAFSAADMLIPQTEDLSAWAVVACDQFTSQPEYWEETEKLAGDKPSALRLILPEVWLEAEDVDKRISQIHENMKKYLEAGLFREVKDSFVYVERVQSDGKMRAGIVGAVDLEMYDYSKGSQSPVRATEATVVERIPPRIKVREGAEMELPHIMILIDDGEKTVIEPLENKKDKFEKLYEFELMQGGGKISGWLVDKETAGEIQQALEALGDKQAFDKKYGIAGKQPLVYAMGDGNHSLATAKAYYEKLKAENPEKDMSSHPARYALAEVVDLHSPALEFEAIHRIVTGVDREKLMAGLEEMLGLSDRPSEQKMKVVTDGEEREVYIHEPLSKLTVGSLQNALDKLLGELGGKVDYIHGAEVVRELSASPDAVGFLLPDMEKSELFPTVILDGSLPRKTFSMGHAQDKKYYVEARRIR